MPNFPTCLLLLSFQGSTALLVFLLFYIPFSRHGPLLYLLSLALVLPSALAGPACSKKHFQSADCIQLCRSRWGWSGASMGSDPWGAVVHETDQSFGDIVSKACGATVTRFFFSSVVCRLDLIHFKYICASDPLQCCRAFVFHRVASSTQIASPIQITSSSSVLPPTSTSTLVESSSSSSPVAATISAQESASSVTLAPDNFTSTRSSKSAKATTHTTVSSVTAEPTTEASPTTTSIRVASTSSTTARAAETSSSASASTGSTTSSSDIDAYLAGHNTVRANHGASALTWSDELASKAQQWANGCVFEHSGGSLGDFGEDLAAGGGDFSITSAVKLWTDEASEYDPSNPVPSHFTQVVWKATTQVGCAVQSCDGILDGTAKYYVCEYFPAGNVIGEFAENVQA
ncbi:CAP domain-containing protein [Cyathus striatus]|nr:CAP domain-containing protein [Cyathus striatus]